MAIKTRIPSNTNLSPYPENSADAHHQHTQVLTHDSKEDLQQNYNRDTANLPSEISTQETPRQATQSPKQQQARTPSDHIPTQTAVASMRISPQSPDNTEYPVASPSTTSTGDVAAKTTETSGQTMISPKGGGSSPVAATGAQSVVNRSTSPGDSKVRGACVCVVCLHMRICLRVCGYVVLACVLCVWTCVFV